MTVPTNVHFQPFHTASSYAILVHCLSKNSLGKKRMNLTGVADFHSFAARWSWREDGIQARRCTASCKQMEKALSTIPCGVVAAGKGLKSARNAPRRSHNTSPPQPLPPPPAPLPAHPPRKKDELTKRVAAFVTHSVPTFLFFSLSFFLLLDFHQPRTLYVLQWSL